MDAAVRHLEHGGRRFAGEEMLLLFTILELGRKLKKGMTDLFDADAMGKSGRTLNQEGKHGSKEKPPRLVPARDAMDC